MSEPAAILVPLVSPFTDDGTQLSEVRLARVIRWHKEQGAAGFLVGADAGEWWALALAERKQLVEWTVREARGLPVCVHGTAWTTAAVLDICQSASRHGALAAVVCPPPGIPLDASEEEGLAAALRRFVDMPVSLLSSRKAEAPPQPIAWKLLEHPGLAALALSREPRPEEAEVSSYCLHPGGIFGARALLKMASEPVRFKAKLQALARLASGPRAAKAALRLAGLDAGPCRAPINGPSLQAEEILSALAAEVGIV